MSAAPQLCQSRVEMCGSRQAREVGRAPVQGLAGASSWALAAPSRRDPVKNAGYALGKRFRSQISAAPAPAGIRLTASATRLSASRPFQ
jgi:hypothetical protein